MNEEKGMCTLFDALGWALSYISERGEMPDGEAKTKYERAKFIFDSAQMAHLENDEPVNYDEIAKKSHDGYRVAASQ